MTAAPTTPSPRALARPVLPRGNWAACLVAMEEFAIFHLRWEPGRASYAIERLQEAHAGMVERGEVGEPLAERMADDAAWAMFDAWGDAWDGVNAGRMSTTELLTLASNTMREVDKLHALRDEMKAGMDLLDANPDRAKFVYARLNQLGVPAKRTLPMDHPDYVSSGAMFRLAMAFGELWDHMREK